jgi:restriction endonuclease Mrr
MGYGGSLKDAGEAIGKSGDEGIDPPVLLEKPVKKSVLRDKREDHYHEKVIDPDTRETIHECEEPLSKHQDHGSAKYKKKP